MEKNLYNRNRKKLLDKIPEKSLVLLMSNISYPRNGDQYFPFRQDSNFFYLTGLHEKNIKLIIYKGETEETNFKAIYIEKTDSIKEVWDGPSLNINDATDISGIDIVKYHDQWKADLQQKMTICKKVFVDMEESDNPFFEYKNAFFRKIQNDFPLHQFENLRNILTELRTIKEKEEIIFIKKAISITEETFLDVVKTIRPGKTEKEVEAAISYGFNKRAASGHAFAPIIAGGKNACTLHYIKNNSTLDDQSLVLLDFGAEYNNYAADCSRTLPVNGRFTPRQRQIYNILLDIFKKARNEIREGITINSINEKVISWLKETHIALGLYKEKEVENDPGLTKKYYPHGIGHFMGLDVHDVGGKDLKLKSGMVLTCEPGIYIPEEKTGIRLENDILVTPDGNEDLMKDIPIEIDDIEKLMRQD